MPIDTTNLPISGSAIVAMIFYTGISGYVTGPVVGKRTIVKSSWSSQCAANLRSRLQSQLPPSQITPKFDCNSILGLWGSQGRNVCRKYGSPIFNLPGLDQLNEQQRRLREHKQQRLGNAASQVGSRCSCAISVNLEKHRVSWGLFAASLRVVSPPAVENYKSELDSALHSPLCTRKG